MGVCSPWRKGGYAGFLTDKKLDIKQLRSGPKLSQVIGKIVLGDRKNSLIGSEKFSYKTIFTLLQESFQIPYTTDCNVLELVDNFGFLISFFFDKFIC